MMIRLFIAAALAAALLPAQNLQAQPASSDTAQTLTLSALLDEVRASNPALQAARFEASAQATRGRQARALPDPTASVTYQPYPVLTARGYQRSQWRLQQQIPFPGKRRLRGKIADLGAEVSRRETDVLAEDLMLRAKEAFYELYRTQEQIRLVRAFEDRLENFEEVAATRYEVGNGPQQAVLKAQLEKNRLRRRLMDLTQAKRSAALALARLQDRPSADALASGIVQLEQPPISVTAAEAQAVAMAHRPEVAALQTQVKQAGAEVELARKQFWPDFTLNLNYFDIGAGGPMPSMTGRDAVALNVGLKIPLWRGKLQAGLQEARLRRQETRARHADLQTAIRKQVDDLLSRIETERRTLTLYEETLIPQAETALESTFSAYTTGQTDFLDLLDSERTLFELQITQEATMKRYLDATAALERALGTPLSGAPAP